MTTDADGYKGNVKFPDLPEYVFIGGPGRLIVFPEPESERERHAPPKEDET
jgi:hypothetical protein